MSDDNDSYTLSEAGAELVKNVLLKAVNALGFDMTAVNKTNLSDYLQTLTDCDQIWEGTNITDHVERKILLFMVLGSYVGHKPTTSKKYN